MSTSIRLKKSSVSSNAPTTGDIDYGELAINYADGKLYYKTSSNTIDYFGASSIGGGGYWTQNGSDVYYNTGNVGIGVTSPGEALEVDGNIEITGEFIGDLRGPVTFKAQAGENLTLGDAVYISGVNGQLAIVSKADADDAAKMPAFGLVSATTTSGNPCTVVTFGTFIGYDTVNTLDSPTWQRGDTLYVSTTPGGLTNVAPAGESSLIQNIGLVQRIDATDGRIKVGGAGRTNAVPNLNEGRLFVGNASNKAVADDTVHIDIANTRVGINDTTPSYTLDVNGTFRTTGNSIIGDGVGDTLTINAGTIDVPSISSGTDNTVLVYNGTSIVTDEIDPRVWGSTLVDGSGTTNYITKWSDSNTVTDSVITDDGTTVTIGGNLTVNGTTTTLNATNSVVTDNLFELNSGVTSNANDSGIIIERGSTGDNALFIWDESADKFALGTTTATADSTGNITYTNAGLIAGTLDISGDAAFDTDTLFVDVSADRVGIGTTSPAHKLSVFGDSSGNRTEIGIDNIDQRLVLGAYYETGVGQYATIQSTNNAESSALDLVLQPDGGDVGIGTASPAEKLHVSGNIMLDNNTALLSKRVSGNTLNLIGINNSGQGVIEIGEASTVPDGMFIYTPTDAGQGVTFHNGTDPLMFIENDGNVGIGTTTPAANLQVVSQNRAFSVIDSGTDNYAEAAFTTLGGDGPAFGRLSGYDIQLQTGTTRGGLATVMHLDNDGNVGIGTTGPSAKLHVNNSAATHTLLYLQQTNTSYNTDINLYNANNTTSSTIVSKRTTGDLWLYQSGANNVSVFTSGAERMRIDSSGNVGIGTTSPDADLHVVGSTILGVDAATGPRLRAVGSGDDFYLQASNSSTGGTGTKLNFAKMNSTDTTMTVDIGNEKVGIGTTSPGAKLSISDGNIGIDGNNSPQQFYGAGGNVAGTNTSGGVLTVIGHSPNAVGDLSAPPYDGSNFVGASGLMARGFSESGQYRGSLEFFTKTASATNATSRMLISHDGKVGIGTQSPSNTLHVENTTSSGAYINYDGQSNTEFGLRIESNAGGGNFESDFGAGGTALLDLYANSATVTGGDLLVARTQSATPVMLVRGNGRVGIGTASPSHTLDVSGEFRVNGGGTGSIVVNDEDSSLCPTMTFLRNGGGTTTNDFIKFENSGGEVAAINATGGGYFIGNLGIGTSSPVNTLDINGSLKINGEIVELAVNTTGVTGSTALDPANGTIQRLTFSGNVTFTDSLANGESITLHIDDGTAYTATWPTMEWVGGSAPTLDTTNETIILIWKVNSTLYGMSSGVSS